ncbi:MAG: GWxTD domain-containing protein [Candidatus Neomarinimicrobiota bacterium]|nr:GWxTD domain-containing protein [Candidatus Neomarinimicrobiota bacterium]
MHKFYIVFFTVLNCLSSQTISLLPTPFDMSVDQFQGDDTKTEVVVNLMIPKKLFQWVDDGNEYKFEGLVDIRVFIQGETAAQDVYRILEKSVDRPGLNERLVSMVQQSRFLLTRGSVVFTATITDLSSKQVYVSTKNVIIRKIDDSYLSTSDLILCTFLKREKEFDEGSINRNGITITPNPSSVFGLGRPMLYTYGELYGFNNDNGTYTLNYKIYNQQGKELIHRGPFIKNKPGESSVETFGMNIMGLLAGRYRLRLDIQDDQTEKNTFIDREFFVVKEQPVDFKSNITIILDAMENDELNDFLDIVGYFMTESELQTLIKSDRTEQIVQIANFFEQRDFDSETSQNEFYNRLNKYLAIADQQFSTRNFLGRNTDRGRVLILYGRPKDIESYNANEERLSYEIWHYDDSDKGYVFIFINKEDGSGMFEQIHSSHPNEFRNYRWKDMIIRGTTNLIDF